MSPIVCKFGGTSVSDAKQILKVKAIIESDPNRKFVVVSAPGKRYSEDKKVTDLLLLAYQTAKNGLDHTSILDLVMARYQEIADDLGVTIDLKSLFREVAKNLPNLSSDYAASRGEFAQGKLMAAFLGAQFVDPMESIFFNEAGILDSQRTYEILEEKLKGDGLFVIPGFYGCGSDGAVKTFSRGGSDITGAIVARAARASLYENWTDVSGLLMADPRVIDNPKPMPAVTYLELRELSYMGASVLHDEAIFPVKELGIPIQIKNTNDPSHPGTTIASDRDPGEHDIVGVSGKKGFEVIHMSKTLMNTEIGFGRKLLEIIESYGINFEHLPSGIDSLSIVLSQKDLNPHRENLLADIQNILKVDTLKTHPKLALLAVVGKGMAHQCGTASRTFSALSENHINVRLIGQVDSEISIIVGVNECDLEKALSAIYKSFEPS